MIKKTIKYTDFNGTERTEDYYFNLTKAELTDMELSTEGGLDNLINRIVKEQNVPEIMKIFKSIIAKSYGIKSDDGKYFRKSEDAFNDFASTGAYDELLIELMSNAEASSAFIKGILPTGLEKELESKESNKLTI